MGARHVLVKKFDPTEVLELIQKERVTNFAMVPTMANAIINHPSLGEYDLSSLDYIGYRRRGIAGRSDPRWSSRSLAAELTADTGLTETMPVLTQSFIKDHLKDVPDEERWRRQAMTGFPMPGVEIESSTRTTNLLPHDGTSVGEVVVRADNVMAGYWKLPEETATVMRSGWFHTGDMATVDEYGYFLIVDRKKDIIISGGENIASIEVEKAVYSHPAVFECAVVAVPDDRWGEVPKALVVVKPGESLSEQEVIDHCRTKLPGLQGAEEQSSSSTRFQRAAPGRS